ncbi:MAG: hypothetical protein V3V91_08200 [Thermoplasmata archaeon]
MTLRWRRLGLVLLRALILFALSAVLVGGFWFHAEFYKLGLPILIITGAVTVTMMVLAFRFAITGEYRSFSRPKGFLEFELDELDRVRHGLKKSTLRKPQEKREIRPGNVVSARLIGNDDTEVLKLRIAGIDRKYLADFDKGDLRALGIGSKGELSEMWGKLGGRLDERVCGELIFFERLGRERRK